MMFSNSIRRFWLFSMWALICSSRASSCFRFSLSSSSCVLEPATLTSHSCRGVQGHPKAAPKAVQVAPPLTAGQLHAAGSTSHAQQGERELLDPSGSFECSALPAAELGAQKHSQYGRSVWLQRGGGQGACWDMSPPKVVAWLAQLCEASSTWWC